MSYKTRVQCRAHTPTKHVLSHVTFYTLEELIIEAQFICFRLVFNLVLTCQNTGDAVWSHFWLIWLCQSEPIQLSFVGVVGVVVIIVFVGALWTLWTLSPPSAHYLTKLMSGRSYYQLSNKLI